MLVANRIAFAPAVLNPGALVRVPKNGSDQVRESKTSPPSQEHATTAKLQLEPDSGAVRARSPDQHRTQKIADLTPLGKSECRIK